MRGSGFFNTARHKPHHAMKAPSYTIHKVRHAYRVRFAGKPHLNANRPTRFEAEQYASRELARITANERSPAAWPHR